MTYVALLRGIAPTNPNMSNENLRKVFVGLGLKNVQTVISSGNVIFESQSKNAKALERKIEATFPKKLGFNSTTIIRSQPQLRKLIAKDPFHGKKHSKRLYLIVTFRKRGGEVFGAIRPESRAGAKFMADLEKAHGKDITTRTWKTVERISTIMEQRVH